MTRDLSIPYRGRVTPVGYPHAALSRFAKSQYSKLSKILPTEKFPTVWKVFCRRMENFMCMFCQSLHPKSKGQYRATLDIFDESFQRNRYGNKKNVFKYWRADRRAYIRPPSARRITLPKQYPVWFVVPTGRAFGIQVWNFKMCYQN